eukprot:5585408-Alexandrium_andersonii.AAC.1
MLKQRPSKDRTSGCVEPALASRTKTWCNGICKVVASISILVCGPPTSEEVSGGRGKVMRNTGSISTPSKVSGTNFAS